MIDPAPILKIVPIFALALIAPGPDFMMISSMALSRGRAAGMLAATGIAASVLVYTVLCMFGLGIVFASMQWLITAIRLCGGVYLVYLGVHLWRASLKPQSGEAEVDVSRSGNSRNPFVIGFFTNMTNPKAMAFFTSIFALTLPPDASHATQAAMVLVMMLMPVLWFGIVTFGLSAPSTRKVYMKWSRWIDRVSGTFLAFFGLRLMFSGRD